MLSIQKKFQGNDHLKIEMKHIDALAWMKG